MACASVLLEYASPAGGATKADEGAGDYLETLIDDSLPLPAKLRSKLAGGKVNKGS